MRLLGIEVYRMPSLSLPKNITARTVPSWLGAWSGALGAEELEIQFAADSFLEPGPIAILAAGVAARKLKLLKTSIQFDQASDSFRFSQLHPIVTKENYENLALESGKFLERQLPAAPTSVVRGLRFIIEELGANIVQHCGRPETGFGLAQAYPQQNRVQLAFAGSGVGFLASLQRNLELAGRVSSDAEAIQLATTQGLSGVEGRTNMGMGIPLLCDISDRLGSDLWILSGSALLYRRTLAGKRVATVSPCPNWQGAWICLDTPVFPGGGGT